MKIKKINAEWESNSYNCMYHLQIFLIWILVKLKIFLGEKNAYIKQ